MKIKKKDYVRITGNIKGIYEYFSLPKFKLQPYDVCFLIASMGSRVGVVDSVKGGLVYTNLTEPFHIGVPENLLFKTLPPMNYINQHITHTEELVLELEKRGYKVKITNTQQL